MNMSEKYKNNSYAQMLDLEHEGVCQLLEVEGVDIFVFDDNSSIEFHY